MLPEGDRKRSQTPAGGKQEKKKEPAENKMLAATFAKSLPLRFRYETWERIQGRIRLH